MRITGTPTTACACSVTVTATDGSGFHGSATFTWNITNTVSVTNPGAQTSLSGSAISALHHQRHRLLLAATLTYRPSRHLPTGAVHLSSTGVITGTPTTAGPTR